MSDLRACLADALREHEPFRINVDGGWIGCSCDGGFSRFTAAAHRSHLADVLLSLPGIAIVELPEPTGSEPATEDENGFVEWEYPHGAVQVFDGGVIGWGRWHFEDATKLREAASALLAAANAAEGNP